MKKFLSPSTIIVILTLIAAPVTFMGCTADTLTGPAPQGTSIGYGQVGDLNANGIETEAAPTVGSNNGVHMAESTDPDSDANTPPPGM